MDLTKNFTLEEMTVTHEDMPNIPDVNAIHYLTQLCINVLQPLRDIYGKPIKVDSGFRCLAVNAAVGGVASSQHLQGKAADLNNGSIENEKMFNLIRAKLPFDQLINEKNFSWIHVSFNPNANRKQVLVFKNGKYIQI